MEKLQSAYELYRMMIGSSSFYLILYMLYALPGILASVKSGKSIFDSASGRLSLSYLLSVLVSFVATFTAAYLMVNGYVRIEADRVMYVGVLLAHEIALFSMLICTIVSILINFYLLHKKHSKR